MTRTETIIQNTDGALSVIKNAAEWLQKTGKGHSEWWDPENMNLEFFAEYAKPDEFYVLMKSNKPAAAVILQKEQNLQDWSAVDKNKPKDALYIHYVAVHRDFAGQNLVTDLIDFAESLAKKDGIDTLRLDTDADEPKLCSLYENLGFGRVEVLEEPNSRTALYEKEL